MLDILQLFRILWPIRLPKKQCLMKCNENWKYFLSLIANLLFVGPTWHEIKGTVEKEEAN